MIDRDLEDPPDIRKHQGSQTTWSGGALDYFKKLLGRDPVIDSPTLF
jgi:hypothetical protein